MSSSGPSGRRKTITLVLVTLALAGVIVVTLVARNDESDTSGDDGYPPSELTLEEATAPLKGASPELAGIRKQANELLDGGASAFDERLAELEGTPVVVNVWGSWCGPCISEFPHFQSVAAENAEDVAFLGVDIEDTEAAASQFLERLPVPYPSYEDPDKAIATSLKASIGVPNTIFIGADGEVDSIHFGPYTSEADLAAEVEKLKG